MTLSDFFKLIRHYIKVVIIVPVVCAFVATSCCCSNSTKSIAKATLLTNGDIALAGGYAQNEASTFSKKWHRGFINYRYSLQNDYDQG